MQHWVGMAKNAGMKYITLITRHHDGFSMWDTKFSDFNIMNTPYHKDIVKMMADECHKQGISCFYIIHCSIGEEMIILIGQEIQVMAPGELYMATGMTIYNL